jgi:hypothetical protein
VRRGRIDADDWAAADIPLGEASESYQVVIGSAGDVTVRTAQIGEPKLTYRRADALADFGTVPDAVRLTVQQVSAAVGPGVAASTVLALL